MQRQRARLGVVAASADASVAAKALIQDALGLKQRLAKKEAENASLKRQVAQLRRQLEPRVEKQ